MTTQDSLFLISKQPRQKLEIAVSRFLLAGEDIQGRYQSYLKKRLRPALLWIIENGSAAMLRRLLKEFQPEESLRLEAVRRSGELGRAEMTALLMQKLPDESVSLPSSSVSLSERVIRLESLKLYEAFPFFGTALARLSFCPVSERAIGTDGTTVFYHPALLLYYYKHSMLRPLLLHMLLHCLFLHILPPAGASRDAWDRRCDDIVRQELEKLGVLDGVPANCRQNVPLDSHKYWYSASAPAPGDHSGGEGFDPNENRQELLRTWSALHSQLARTTPSDRLPSNRGTMGGSRKEWMLLRERGRFDFRRYLHRFCVTAEELQTDPDSIDPIPYHYGMQHYGNMPLIEPLETGETSRIQELVIAIDTSGSCSYEIVRRFLDETCSILTNREYFFRRMRVHLIQCDCVIQDHQIITSREEWRSSSARLLIHGRGGTDFTPVFSYVEKLRRQKQIQALKGLLYFTDGDGIYPQEPTDYETAFVFSDQRFRNFKIPGWITPLCLENSDFSGKS